jgi:uncharacterized protein (TIGR03083 family)
VTERLNKAQILARLHAEYEHLQATLAKLTAEQMLQPNVVGVWSVKDVTAHLVFWNRYPVIELQHALEGKPYEFDHSKLDEHNARAVAEYAGRSVQETLADFEATFRQVVQAIEALPDTAFEAGNELERILDDTVSGAFGNNTWEQYREHGDQIRGWMNMKGTTGV